MTSPCGGPRVLVLTGGLVHLVNQLAVVIGLGERQGWLPGDLGVLVTGVLRDDPTGLEELHQGMQAWFMALRMERPLSCSGLRLLEHPTELAPGDWDIACLNNLWQRRQRQHVERLGIGSVLVCGDGVGIYYRCARELRAIVPSLLGLPIPESGRKVQLFLEGRQPLWHRPPCPAAPVPLSERGSLFDSLVATLGPGADGLVKTGLAQSPPGRPLWLCSVPNLAHQFPGQRIPVAVLEAWLDHLDGFQRGKDRLLLIDHPKAPPGGSFGPKLPPSVASPIRSSLPLELLVRRWQQTSNQRPVLVAGMTSALVGVRRLTGVPVHWLPVVPLWWANPAYRRQPQEYLHRWLRVKRMALLCSEATPGPAFHSIGSACSQGSCHP